MSPPFTARLQHLLPKDLISAVVRRAARSRVRWLKSTLIRGFVRLYSVDTSEAAIERLADYETFNAFFTRALKPGVRPVDGDPNSVVAPADGHLSQLGALDRGRLVQAKGLTYALDELIGEPALPETLARGRFATIYLAPPDYHRVHAPFSGELVLTRYVPGRRFAVNRATAAVVRRLFGRNERVVMRFETRFGPAYVVLVGALNVSSLSTAAVGEIESGRAREWHHAPAVAFAKGDELGRFNLGSTVVVILPAGPFTFADEAVPDRHVQMGQRLGRYGRP